MRDNDSRKSVFLPKITEHNVILTSFPVDLSNTQCLGGGGTMWKIDVVRAERRYEKLSDGRRMSLRDVAKAVRFNLSEYQGSWATAACLLYFLYSHCGIFYIGDLVYQYRYILGMANYERKLVCVFLLLSVLLTRAY